MNLLVKSSCCCPACGSDNVIISANIFGNGYDLGCMSCNPERDWDLDADRMKSAIEVFCDTVKTDSKRD